ncbi:MAG TPA: hypothetical protein EYP08_05830 [Pyrodictiaceae archaeon]|nr:hypothetical protein [Pyrodictiaceae archaeon]
MLRRGILAPLLVAMLLTLILVGVAQTGPLYGYLFFEPNDQRVLVGRNAVVKLKYRLEIPPDVTCDSMRVKVYISVPAPLELVNFTEYTGSHRIREEDGHKTVYYYASIYSPEEGVHTLAQLVVRAHKPGTYTISGGYGGVLTCTDETGNSYSVYPDGKLVATVSVVQPAQPKPKIAPPAAGVVGLLFLVGGLVAPLPSEQRQVMLVLASMFILATLLMTAGILPAPF